MNKNEAEDISQAWNETSRDKRGMEEEINKSRALIPL